MKMRKKHQRGEPVYVHLKNHLVPRRILFFDGECLVIDDRAGQYTMHVDDERIERIEVGFRGFRPS